MTEIVEYTLVVMVSTFFVAGSVVTYNAFSSYETGLQFSAAVQAVSSLASEAETNGSSTATLSLPATTFACEYSSLRVTSGTMSEVLPVSLPCDFDVSTHQGPHVLRFTVSYSQLFLSVS